MKRMRADDLHQQWLKDPKYRREYEALAEEFSATAALASGAKAAVPPLVSKTNCRNSRRRLKPALRHQGRVR